MDLNEVNLIGRATADAELKQTPQGQYVTTFSIATGEKFTKEDGTKVETVEFSNIVVWGKLAEIAGKYVTKGKRLYLKGKLKTRNWDDKDSGKKMYRTEIVGKDLILLDGGNKEN
jgi:single-strand DNA-binding protein